MFFSFANDQQVRAMRALVRDLRDRMIRPIDKAAMAVGFGPAEWAMWQAVCGERGNTSAWLVEMLDLDRGQVSRILKLWEQHEKFVVTSPAEYNARIKRVQLTDIGRSMDRELQREANAIARGILDRLPNADREALLEALTVASGLLARVDPRYWCLENG